MSWLRAVSAGIRRSGGAVSLHLLRRVCSVMGGVRSHHGYGSQRPATTLPDDNLKEA
jgi:hypothetical protein